MILLNTEEELQAALPLQLWLLRRLLLELTVLLVKERMLQQTIIINMVLVAEVAVGMEAVRIKAVPIPMLLSDSKMVVVLVMFILRLHLPITQVDAN